MNLQQQHLYLALEEFELANLFRSETYETYCSGVRDYVLNL